MMTRRTRSLSRRSRTAPSSRESRLPAEKSCHVLRRYRVGRRAILDDVDVAVDLAPVVIGGKGADHIEITVKGRPYADAQHADDQSWLIGDISFKLGSFRGRISSAYLRTGELLGFLRDLEQMNESLAGTAHLDAIEQWVDLTIEMRSRGALHVEGELVDNPGLGNRLRFQIDDLDQSYLPLMIQSLRAVEAAVLMTG